MFFGQSPFHPVTNGPPRLTFPAMHLITPADLTTFARVESWIFDLDNTLYPAECNLFARSIRGWASSSPATLGVPL